MLSCETSLRYVNKRYVVSVFAQFCAFEQEFRAVVFVYFPGDPYGLGCSFVGAVLEKVIQLSRLPRKMHLGKRKKEGRGR